MDKNREQKENKRKKDNRYLVRDNTMFFEQKTRLVSH